MATNRPEYDAEDARTDLLAAMAASRELGPEMDKAVVDSYMEKHHPVSPQPAAQHLTQPAAPSGEMFSSMVMCLGIVAYVALLVVSHGMLWWMFWPLMGWAGWRWHNWSGDYGGASRTARDQYRQSRWEYRMQRRAARLGLPYPIPSNNEPPALPPQYPPTAYPPTAYPPQYPPAAQYPATQHQPPTTSATDPGITPPPSNGGNAQPPLHRDD